MKPTMRALAVTVLLAAPLAAQEAQPESAGMHQLLELARSDFRTQKVAIVTAAMPLTEQQAAAFWPVYRQYEAELTALWDQRLALIKDYAQSYQAMTDADRAALARRQGATHVIAAPPPARASADPGSPLELLHIEGRYAVYRVRASAPVEHGLALGPPGLGGLTRLILGTPPDILEGHERPPGASCCE